MKAYALIAADLFAVLSVTFMVALGVIAPLVQNEVLTFIESTKTDKETDVTAPDSKLTGLLQIRNVKSKPEYHLQLNNQDSKKYTNYKGLINALKAVTPNDLRIRIDRRVESGIYQDLLIDTSQLNIQLWQANDGK